MSERNPASGRVRVMVRSEEWWPWYTLLTDTEHYAWDDRDAIEVTPELVARVSALQVEASEVHRILNHLWHEAPVARG